MSIYKTLKGWGIDYRDEYNRRHRKQVPTEQAAKQLDTAIHQRVSQARQQIRTARANPAMELDSAIQLFLQSRPMSDHTLRDTTARLRKLREAIGNIPITDVTPRLLEDWHTQRAQTIAPSSLTLESIYVRALFRYLRDHWHLPESPAEHLPTRRRRTSAGRVLSHAEELQTLLALTSFRTHAQFLCGLDAGMRTGEVATLRLNQINWQEGTITVHPSKPGPIRHIPMTPRLHLALAALIPNPATRDPDSLIFSYRSTHRTRMMPLRHTYKHGAPIFRFHDLRHTFASRLARLHVAPHIIRILLGHSLRTTTDIYLHAETNDLQDAILLLAEHNQAALSQLTRQNPPLTRE
jgi:integrase